jgi:hypothetical protein
MIVCKQCGFHNEEGDTFCGSCGSFLEWVGEKVGDEPEPAPEVVVPVQEVEDDKKPGFIHRLKEKIAGEDDDDVPGMTENPGADIALSPEELKPEVPATAEVAATTIAAASVPDSAPAGGLAATPDTSALVDAPSTALPHADAPAAAVAHADVPTAVAHADAPAAPADAPSAGAVAGAAALAGGLAAPAGSSLAPPGAGAHLPPPAALTPDEAAKRAADAKRLEDERKRAEAEAKRKADEQAKVEAEQEAQRKADEAKRRAALLVAKPKSVETPEQAKAATVAAAPAEAKKGRGKGKAGAPEEAVVAAVAVEARTPGAQQPGAQKPGAAAKAKPKVVKEPPSRVIKPGDLVCGECGEGNDVGRKFCRRCGTSLVDAPVAKKPGFFKRLFTRKPKAAAEAGSRPGRGGGGGGGGKKGNMGRSGRQAKGKFLGVFGSARQFLAILAIFGIGVGFLLPNVRGKIFDGMNSGINKVKSIVSPSYSTVFVDQAQSQGSSETPGAGAALASNGIKNDHWAPLPTDQTPQLQLRFEDPTNLDILFVYSGNQDDTKNFAANPRPKDLFVTMIDSKLQKFTKQIRLDDKPAAQKFTLNGKNVKTVIVDIQSCYPDPQNRSCAITELEFQRKKT